MMILVTEKGDPVKANFKFKWSICDEDILPELQVKEECTSQILNAAQLTKTQTQRRVKYLQDISQASNSEKIYQRKQFTELLKENSTENKQIIIHGKMFEYGIHKIKHTAFKIAHLRYVENVWTS